MEKKKITEEMKVHEEWYKEANDLTLETLPAFMKKLTEEYDHDYGTICHAVAASGIGAMYAINKSDQGGITGFQAGAIMWEFIRHWNYSSNKLGLKLLNYDDLLFPQYDYKFKNTMTSKFWKKVQEEAKKNLAENKAAEAVAVHWQSIADGILPFGFEIKEEE